MSVYGADQSSLEPRVAALEGQVPQLSDQITGNAGDAASALSQEADARIAGDQTLTALVNAEQVARIAGDQALADQIADLVTAVATGDAINMDQVNLLAVKLTQALGEALAFSTWAEAQAIDTTRVTPGHAVKIYGPDAGTHIDPVQGGAPVSNTGIYTVVAGVGLKRIANLEIVDVGALKDAAAASAQVAAASAADAAAVLPSTSTPVFVRVGPSGEPVMIGFAATDDAGAGAPILTNDGQLLRMGPDGTVELVIGRDEVAAADDAVRAEFAAADATLQDEIDALAASSGSAAVEAALPTGQSIGVAGRRIAMGVAGPTGAGLPLVTEDGRLLQLLPTGWPQLVPLARIEKLRRAAQRALAFNPDDADIATGVTMTVNAATDATLANSYTASANLDLFRFAGGNVIANGSGSSLYFPTSSVAPATNGNIGSVDTVPDDQQAWGWRTEFETDASKVEVRIGSSTAERFRVLVDGRYVSKTPSYGLNYVAYLSLDFSSVRRPRVIGVEGSDTNTFRGVSVGATANIWRPQRSPDRIVALCTGDSYSEGQGATPSAGVLGFPQMLGRMLGWTDVRQVAVGGTGYFNTGPSGARSKLYDQIDRWMTVNSDLRPDDVDVVTCLSGYNDYPAISGTTYTPTEIAAEALRCWRKMRALLPGALIIVGGPHSGSRGPDQRTIDIEAALAAAFSVWADPFSAYVPLAPSTARAWISGTGRVGATTGSGNADVMITTDATHPTELGHQLYARRLASEIRRIIANFA